MVTIKDVARRAQVSVATVSRVLNGNPAVDPELARRVRKAVQALQYRPNRLARNLRTRSTRVIALVVPDIQNSFFVLLSRGIEEVAFREGYVVLVCNTDDDPQREAAYLQVLGDEFVAGIVICPTDEQLSAASVLNLLDRGMAVISVDRRLPDAPVDCVLSDNVGGSYAAVSHLAALGHRRIGVVAGPHRFTPGRERLQGYTQALEDQGLTVQPELIRQTDFRSSESEAATAELLGLPEPPTALFVCSGSLALGALQAIHRQSLHTPSEISVVVFDDSPWAEAYNPPLTVAAQDTRHLGVTAAQLLLDRIRGGVQPPQEHRLPARLIDRHSCARPGPG